MIYIKRLILPLIFLCLFLFGCQRELNPLAYQERFVSAELTINEKFKATLKKDGDKFTLTLSEPSQIAGLVVEASGDEGVILYDDLKIPVKMDEISGIYLIVNAFDLSCKDSFLLVDKGEDSTLIFETELAEYTLTFNSSLAPYHIEICSPSCNYSIDVNGILLRDNG